MRINYFLFIITCFSLFSTKINAQTSFNDPSDNQVWTGVEFKYYDLLPKLSVEVNYQQRYWNNASNLKGHYSGLELGYKINRFIDILADYRLVLRDKGQYHRFSLGANYERKFFNPNFKLSGRILVQNQYQDYTDEINANKPDERFIFYRGRLKGSYKINKKMDVYASVEPIFRVGGVFIVDNWRSQLGFTFDITKKLKSDVYFIYREDYAKATYNRYFYISGLNLSYKLNRNPKRFKPVVNEF